MAVSAGPDSTALASPRWPSALQLLQARTACPEMRRFIRRFRPPPLPVGTRVMSSQSISGGGRGCTGSHTRPCVFDLPKAALPPPHAELVSVSGRAGSGAGTAGDGQGGGRCRRRPRPRPRRRPRQRPRRRARRRRRQWPRYRQQRRYTRHGRAAAGQPGRRQRHGAAAASDARAAGGERGAAHVAGCAPIRDAVLMMHLARNAGALRAAGGERGAAHAARRISNCVAAAPLHWLRRLAFLGFD